MRRGRVVVGVDDERHARDARLGACGRRERHDVVAAAPEQRRDAVQDAGPVLDVGDEGSERAG